MRPLHGHRILVVEDERPVRMLLRVVLESAGATVVEAENGQQALRLLEVEGLFDLLVSDMNMPELDGAGLVTAIRGRWGNSMPVLMCSAMDVIAQSPELGQLVQGVISKPFSPPALVSAAASAAARAHEHEGCVSE